MKNNRYNFKIDFSLYSYLKFVTTGHTFRGNEHCGRDTIMTYKVMLLNLLVADMSKGKVSITDDDINSYFGSKLFGAKPSHYRTKIAFHQIIKAGIIKPLDSMTRDEIQIRSRKRITK